MVTRLYCPNHLISLAMLDRQRQPLMRTDVSRREIWEWSDHTHKEQHGIEQNYGFLNAHSAPLWNLLILSKYGIHPHL